MALINDNDNNNPEFQTEVNKSSFSLLLDMTDCYFFQHLQLLADLLALASELTHVNSIIWFIYNK